MVSAYSIIQSAWEYKSDSKGTPFMWHIDMGIAWLESQGATEDIINAWCMHPLVQDYNDLTMNQKYLKYISPKAVLFAIEYRHQANWYSTHSKHDTKPRTKLLPEVAMMLKADKLQNCWNLHSFRKDHPNFNWLTKYFDKWFEALGIDIIEVTKAFTLFNSMAERNGKSIR